MRSEIYVVYRASGFHCWPEAPPEVGFLAYPHRHMFHFTLYAKVDHADRQLEFFILQNQLVKVVDDLLENMLGSFSCELLGEEILLYIPEAYKVEVSEDGENGAIVCRE